MKVSELLAEEALKDYLKRLTSSHGIKKLGGGAYSQVFQHPEFGNVVTKVYTAKDKVYARYAEWCLQHQNNPYVPKIIEEVKYKSPTGDAYNILFMQKMKSLTGETQQARLLVKMFKLEAHDDEDLIMDIDDAVWDADSQIFHDVFEEAISRGKGDKHFRELWNHLKTYGTKYLDLHDGNFMLRDKQLVFTDPVAQAPTSRVDDL